VRGLHHVELSPPAQNRPSRVPVVLLPKLGGWAADWSPVAESLATERRVITIDLPGHGGSRMPREAPYAQSPVDSARLLLATLAELSVGRCHLVGTSLGGIVAAMASIARPELCASLALVSVSLASALDRARLDASDAAVREHFDAHWLPLPRGLGGGERFGLVDPTIAAEQDASRAAAGRWVRASERGAALLGLGDHLPAISVPTLVLGGSHGMYVRYEATALERIAGVTVQRVPHSGAFVSQERPSETASALRRFFDRIESTEEKDAR
jgi:pimeloyl-ACP methyl ester carboxylesterase